jgi:hypothetical protein
MDGLDRKVAVGTKLESAGYQQNPATNTQTLSAVLGTEQDVPRVVHFHPDAASATRERVEVKLLRGEQQTAIRKSARVTVHMSAMDSEALVWRKSAEGDLQPLPEGESKLGTRTHNANATIVKTVTNSDGSVTVIADSDPGRVESILYDVEVSTGIDVSGLLDGVLGVVTVPAPPTPGNPPGPPAPGTTALSGLATAGLLVRRGA